MNNDTYKKWHGLERQFVRLRESNSWEGEDWNFYIPVVGNEEAIKHLAVLVEKYPEQTIYPYSISEREIDVLVKNDNNIGYMARHNKLEGKLDFTGFPNKSTNGAEDPFYKGDIQKYLIRGQIKKQSKVGKKQNN